MYTILSNIITIYYKLLNMNIHFPHELLSVDGGRRTMMKTTTVDELLTAYLLIDSLFKLDGVEHLVLRT